MFENYEPADKMETQGKRIERTAQLVSNNWKNGGSKMAVFSEEYDLAEKYTIVENCEAHQLSAYGRQENGYNRSYAPKEGGNKFRNFVGRELVRQGIQAVLVSWCQQQ